MARCREIKTRSFGETPKDERCRMSGCPAYMGPQNRDAKAVNANPDCARCSGPVCWTDPKGVRHGLARACTSCPMDGLGLPVCWAACPGPNEGFGTDGQSMVTTGGMDDPSGYLFANGRKDARPADEAETDDRYPAMMRLVVRRLFAIGAREWDALIFAIGAGHADEVVKTLGVPRQAVRPTTGNGNGLWGSCVGRIVAGIGRDVRGVEWDVIRLLAHGSSQSRIARLSGELTKQAINNRLGRIMRNCPWLAKLTVATGRNVGRHAESTSTVTAPMRTRTAEILAHHPSSRQDIFFIQKEKLAKTAGFIHEKQESKSRDHEKSAGSSQA